MAVITPKYDNDYITYGYYKNDNGDLEKMQEEISKIPKSYSSPPSPPYKIGDMLYYDNKIYRCIASREIGDFNFDDWEVISDNDKSYEEWLEVTYDINNLKIDEQNDGKIETFYQTNDPSSSWTTDLIKNQHTGDYWKSGDIIKKYVRYNTNPITYGWELSKITSTLFNENTGHKNIFIQKPSSYSQYDLWYVNETYEDFNIGEWYSATRNSTNFDKNDFIRYNTNIILEEINNIYVNTDKIEELKTETTSQINSSISSSIDALTSTIQQTYTTSNQVEDIIETKTSTLNQTVDGLVVSVSNTYSKKEINDINNGNDENNKVSYVKTSVLTIDDEGLHIEQNNYDTSTNIDAEGLIVKDSSGNNLLQVHLEQGDGVVRTRNLYADKYLVIGNSRIENGNFDGEDCSCVYWLGE